MSDKQVIKISADLITKSATDEEVKKVLEEALTKFGKLENVYVGPGAPPPTSGPPSGPGH